MEQFRLSMLGQLIIGVSTVLFFASEAFKEGSITAFLIWLILWVAGFAIYRMSL